VRAPRYLFKTYDPNETTGGGEDNFLLNPT
jgi:hypothetical protein